MIRTAPPWPTSGLGGVSSSLDTPHIQYRRLENGSYEVAVVISQEADFDVIDGVTDGLSNQDLPGHVRLMDVDNEGACYAIDAGRTDGKCMFH